MSYRQQKRKLVGLMRRGESDRKIKRERARSKNSFFFLHKVIKLLDHMLAQQNDMIPCKESLIPLLVHLSTQRCLHPFLRLNQKCHRKLRLLDVN